MLLSPLYYITVYYYYSIFGRILDTINNNKLSIYRAISMQSYWCFDILLAFGVVASWTSFTHNYLLKNIQTFFSSIGALRDPFTVFFFLYKQHNPLIKEFHSFWRCTVLSVAALLRQLLSIQPAIPSSSLYRVVLFLENLSARSTFSFLFSPNDWLSVSANSLPLSLSFFSSGISVGEEPFNIQSWKFLEGTSHKSPAVLASGYSYKHRKVFGKFIEVIDINETVKLTVCCVQ